MAAFEYTALDAQGREQKGVMQADNERQIRQQLRERGLIPLTVKGVAEQQRSQAASKWQFKRGLKVADLALLTRQLSTLLSAGLPVEEALQGVAEQTEQSRIKSIIIAVRSKVMEGYPLATGLADFPHVFPELYRATVKAGEESGKLSAVLDRLAEYTEEQQSIRQKIQQAAVYPILMLIVSGLIVVALMVYIVPNIVGVFADSGQELPPLTVGLMTVSEMVQAYGLYTLLLLLVVAVLFRRAERNPNFKTKVDGYRLRIPLIGRVMRNLNTARFAHTFSILSASGVPVLEAMRTGADVMTNLPMRAAVQSATARVREGTSIYRSLQETRYFSPMMIHLLANGEASGQLANMLERAAVIQDKEVDTLIGSVLSLLEPLIILVMGGVVLLIVLAVLLPIFSLTQSVGV
ncbi:MAG: type II secretion system inner membrane protein GspF [Gammaproteobacteria bacterium]